jgi:hypothetical protein
MRQSNEPTHSLGARSHEAWTLVADSKNSHQAWSRSMSPPLAAASLSSSAVAANSASLP